MFFSFQVHHYKFEVNQIPSSLDYIIAHITIPRPITQPCSLMLMANYLSTTLSQALTIKNSYITYNVQTYKKVDITPIISK